MGLNVSVIVPTYNRRPILEKVLLSLADQTLPLDAVEVIVVDDGSSDGTDDMVRSLKAPYHSIYLSTGRGPTSPPGNPSAARNVGIGAARGEVIVFLDSDMVVSRGFLEAHVRAHSASNIVVHGPFIQTSNFDDPRSEKRRWTDASRAFFATGNSSVRKEWLVRAGLFDEDFTEYGWEDLEMGVRLRALGLRSVQATDAVGYHYKPESHEYDLDAAMAREDARARMAAVFLRKHPTFEVRMMVLDLRPYYALEGCLTLGGWPDWPATRRLLRRLSSRGRTPAVLFLAKFITAHAYTKALKRALRVQGARGGAESDT